jgi:hypothetical protein
MTRKTNVSGGRRGRPRRSSNRRNSQVRNPASTLRANGRSREEYAILITGAWQKKIESYLEVGAYLIDAKAKLPGEYEAMIESDLPFDKSTARRLKIIAEHPILSDRAYTHALPARWMTLYLLSQLPSETLVALIEDGTVSPKLQQKDAIALLPSRSGATTAHAHSDDEDLDGCCAFCVEAVSAVRPAQWDLEAENDQPASGKLIDDLAEQVKRILAPLPRRQRLWPRRRSWRRSARPEPSLTCTTKSGG